MNYERLNKLLDYIEFNITNEEKLSNQLLAKILGVNALAFSNIFSFLTNMGIKEYIRYRKLTLAVQDLLNGESVLNTAVKYGYASATSFSRAFLKFHGLKPSEINKESVFVNYAKLHFDTSSDELNNINYRFETITYQKIYGFKQRMMCEQIKAKAPAFWQKMENKNPLLKTITPLLSVIEYPKDFKEMGCYYWIGTHEAINNDYLEITNTKFIVFKVFGDDYSQIPIISKLAYLKYVPSLNKEILDTVSLEIYYDDCIEIWMPIETD